MKRPASNPAGWPVWGLGLMVLGFGAAPPPLRAADSTPWAAGQHSAARLIDAGLPPGSGTKAGQDAAGADRLAGLDIRLDPPFITYWRSPGDAGVPPSFDFAGSDNLEHAEVLYPAPRLFDEDGSVAFGYENGVVFPILVKAKDRTRAVTLDLVADYAICAKICLPAKAKLRLKLEGPPGVEAALVLTELGAVPRPSAIGEPGPIRIDGLDVMPGRTVLRATTPDGTGQLFAEAPEPWYVAASPGPDSADGHLTFTLTVPGPAPPGPVPTAPMRLTLAAPAGAIEIVVPLDAAVSKP